MQLADHEGLDLALETVKNKHELTISNIRSLDIKSSIILALFGILLLPSLELLQWIKRINIFHIFILIPVIVTSIGVLCCLLTLLPQKIKIPPSLAALLKAVEKNKELNNIKAQLYSNFSRAITSNKKIAKRKAFFAKISTWLSIIDFSVIIILFLLKGVIDG